MGDWRGPMCPRYSVVGELNPMLKGSSICRGAYGCRVRSHNLSKVNAKTLRPILRKSVDRKSYLMTDESVVYLRAGRECAGHCTMNHNADEYMCGSFY